MDSNRYYQNTVMQDQISKLTQQRAMLQKHLEISKAKVMSCKCPDKACPRHTIEPSIQETVIVSHPDQNRETGAQRNVDESKPNTHEQPKYSEQKTQHNNLKKQSPNQKNTFEKQPTKSKSTQLCWNPFQKKSVDELPYSKSPVQSRNRKTGTQQKVDESKPSSHESKKPGTQHNAVWSNSYQSMESGTQRSLDTSITSGSITQTIIVPDSKEETKNGHTRWGNSNNTHESRQKCEVVDRRPIIIYHKDDVKSMKYSYCKVVNGPNHPYPMQPFFLPPPPPPQFFMPPPPVINPYQQSEVPAPPHELKPSKSPKHQKMSKSNKTRKITIMNPGLMLQREIVRGKYNYSPVSPKGKGKHRHHSKTSSPTYCDYNSSSRSHSRKSRRRKRSAKHKGHKHYSKEKKSKKYEHPERRSKKFWHKVKELSITNSITSGSQIASKNPSPSPSSGCLKYQFSGDIVQNQKELIKVLKANFQHHKRNCREKCSSPSSTSTSSSSSTEIVAPLTFRSRQRPLARNNIKNKNPARVQIKSLRMQPCKSEIFTIRQEEQFPRVCKRNPIPEKPVLTPETTIMKVQISNPNFTQLAKSSSHIIPIECISIISASTQCIPQKENDEYFSNKFDPIQTSQNPGHILDKTSSTDLHSSLKSVSSQPSQISRDIPKNLSLKQQDSLQSQSQVCFESDMSDKVPFNVDELDAGISKLVKQVKAAVSEKRSSISSTPKSQSQLKHVNWSQNVSSQHSLEKQPKNSKQKTQDSNLKKQSSLNQKNSSEKVPTKTKSSHLCWNPFQKKSVEESPYSKSPVQSRKLDKNSNSNSQHSQAKNQSMLSNSPIQYGNVENVRKNESFPFLSSPSQYGEVENESLYSKSPSQNNHVENGSDSSSHFDLEACESESLHSKSPSHIPSVEKESLHSKSLSQYNQIEIESIHSKSPSPSHPSVVKNVSIYSKSPNQYTKLENPSTQSNSKPLSQQNLSYSHHFKTATPIPTFKAIYIDDASKNVEGLVDRPSYKGISSPKIIRSKVSGPPVQSLFQNTNFNGNRSMEPIGITIKPKVSNSIKGSTKNDLIVNTAIIVEPTVVLSDVVTRSSDVSITSKTSSCMLYPGSKITRPLWQIYFPTENEDAAEIRAERYNSREFFRQQYEKMKSLEN